MEYELLIYVQMILYIVFGVSGGFYALRTLKLLYGNPEMLRTQRRIWVPILVAGGFFSVGGILHTAEHFFYSPDINLVSEFFIIAGLFLFVLSIFRYWSLQKAYDATKHDGLRKVETDDLPK